MSLTAIVTLLQTALLLITTVQAAPNLPQSFRDYATQVANQAIAEATTAIVAINSQQTQGTTSQSAASVPPSASKYSFTISRIELQAMGNSNSVYVVKGLPITFTFEIK